MSSEIVLGGGLGVSFPLQFPNARATWTSIACTPIEQLSLDGEDRVLGNGSGFFWRHNGMIYLITARHCVTGLHAFTNQPLSRTGFRPHSINVYPTWEATPGFWSRAKARIELEKNGEPIWLGDPEFDSLRTDIVAIPTTLDHGIPIQCLNDDASIIEDDLYTLVGHDCAIVGYPKSGYQDLVLPIWRRGTIASEPAFPIAQKPIFAIDALTAPGFSGSPVFRRHFGPLPVEQFDGRLDVRDTNIVCARLIGVYSGRITHRHVAGEVPYAFYANRIPFILNAGC